MCPNPNQFFNSIFCVKHFLKYVKKKVRMVQVCMKKLRISLASYQLFWMPLVMPLKMYIKTIKECQSDTFINFFKYLKPAEDAEESKVFNLKLLVNLTGLLYNVSKYSIVFLGDCLCRKNDYIVQNTNNILGCLSSQL